MKLLIITSVLPYPLNNGGSQAQYNIIEELRNDIDFSLIFIIKTNNEKKSYLELKEKWDNVHFYPIEDIKPKIKKNIFQRMINRFYKFIYKPEAAIKDNIYLNSSLCDRSGSFINEKMINHIHYVVEKEKIELVQTEFFPMLELIYCLPNHIKKLYIQHEIRFIRNKLVLNGLPQNSFYEFIYAKLRNEEIAAMNQYDAVITLTDIDKDKLLSNGVVVPVYSSPAAVQKCITSKEQEHFEFKNKLVFMGGSGHPPNVDAVTWFLNDIWENIRKEYPNITFNIIGNWDIKLQEQFIAKYKRINFLGFVLDLSTDLLGAIMVVPLRVGSGMRMKIIDAVNYRIPFVTTSVGVEGLIFENGVDCFIEDKPELFAEKTLELIKDTALQNSFIKHSNEVYELNYSVEVLSEKRFGVYKNLLKN
jgi:glycosyltransferase involved in cell wall biosynthesis